VRGCAFPACITSIERRHASSWAELISPSYKTWRCTTRPLATHQFSTTLQLWCSLPTFQRTFERRNMMAAQYPHGRDPRNSLGRHSSNFQQIGLRQTLSRRHRVTEIRKPRFQSAKSGQSRRGTSGRVLTGGFDRLPGTRRAIRCCPRRPGRRSSRPNHPDAEECRMDTLEVELSDGAWRTDLLILAESASRCLSATLRW
jgi:hypothetical protein